jgi:thiosulfate dehydrogenase [quinone] large subunit
MAQTVQIEEPRFSRWFFGSTTTAWFWLVMRVWLGWEWFQSGWGKVFGGNIVPGKDFALTGSANIGWIRAGTAMQDGKEVAVSVGSRIAGFAAGAIQASTGPHPSVAYGWYVDFLHWVQTSGHTLLGYVVPLGELLIGVALILGAFTGIAALFGAMLNFTYVFAGSAGVNPAMILVSGLVFLAWRNAGWLGLDRFLLPRLGVPWQPASSAPGSDS